MATEIRVPALGESVTEATVAKWLKKIGDSVAVDDPLVELETDKVTLEVNATAPGTLAEISVPEGGNVGVGGVLGLIGDAGAKSAAPAAKPAKPPAAEKSAPATATTGRSAPTAEVLERSGPAVRRLVEENKLDAGAIVASGKDGRLTKGDVLAQVERSAAPAVTASQPTPTTPPAPTTARRPDEREQRVRMTRLRKRIAERLKQAQNTAAMLTTFNEADMSAVLAARERYRDSFEKKHGVRLGFMSFFVKACIVALKELPAANGEIDGDDLVYKNYYDIGVAVGTAQGLVVPVLRDADAKSFAEIEKTIADLGKRARDGKLSLDELSGGTFTITNDPQPAAIGHSRHAQDRQARRRHRRQDRNPADDVSGAELRSSYRRRSRGGDLPGPRQGMHRGPAAYPPRYVIGTSGKGTCDE